MQCLWNYFKKEVSDEVACLCTHKLQTFLKVDTINSGGHGQSKPKYPKQICKIYPIFQEMRDKVDSLFSQISTFSTGRYYLIRWAWPCIPEVLKITNIQYLSNISKKKWVMKLIFCMLINIKVFCKLILSFLMCLPRHVFMQTRYLKASQEVS